MGRSAERWAHDFERRPVKTINKAIWIAIGSVTAAVILVFGIMTGFSYFWGQGGAVQQKNSTSNFISAQAQFHRDINAINADKINIKSAQDSLTQFNQAHPNYQGNGTPVDPLLDQLNTINTTLTGLKQGCQNEVADYNNAAQSYLSEDWKDAGLPDQLNPSTACNPS